MKTLYVRVQPKQGVEQFFRCGMKFNKTWVPVDVDTATAQRLQAEQMLEVSETKPAELEIDAPREADASGGSTASPVSGAPAAALDAAKTKPKKAEK